MVTGLDIELAEKAASRIIQCVELVRSTSPEELESSLIYDRLVDEIGFPKAVKTSWDDCVVLAHTPAVIAHFAKAEAVAEYATYLKANPIE